MDIVVHQISGGNDSSIIRDNSSMTVYLLLFYYQTSQLDLLFQLTNHEITILLESSLCNLELSYQIISLASIYRFYF
jgi:hypothetical protein